MKGGNEKVGWSRHESVGMTTKGENEKGKADQNDVQILKHTPSLLLWKYKSSG